MANSLTRPPRRAKTCRSAGKAAASETEKTEVEVKVKKRLNLLNLSLNLDLQEAGGLLGQG